MFYLNLIFVFIFGLVVGSFLNCLIWRLRTEEGLSGRSRCPLCGRKISWYDNLPLLSFLFLKGRCRHCGGRISWQYPAVELATGSLFLLVFYLNIAGGEMDYLGLVRNWFVVAVLMVVFVYDLRFYLILDKVMIPSILAVLVLNIFWGVGWQDLLVSAIIGIGFFMIQFLVSRGRWIGGGDIRLGLFMGVALGYWDLLILAIFLAYFIGSLIGIFLIIFSKKKWDSQVPLGVFLATGTLLALLWGPFLIDWYLGLF